MTVRFSFKALGVVFFINIFPGAFDFPLEAIMLALVQVHTQVVEEW